MTTTTKFERIPLEPPPSPGLPAEGLRDSTSEQKEMIRRESTGIYLPTKREVEEDPLERIQQRDHELKRRIRHLKIVHRLIGACLSFATLVPISMTLHKFLSTRDTYKVVTNASLAGEAVRRTAWALQTNTWPTYMYFSIAVISFTFNLAIMISYLRSVKTANLAATVGSLFNTAVLILNLVIWTITAALYKQQAVVTENGKHNDLWGWTCSPAAKLLQPVFDDQINFGQYCDVQAVSWYLGLIQVGAAILSLVLYTLALRRRKSKQHVRKSMTAQGMTTL